jgi:hypothetical protein
MSEAFEWERISPRRTQRTRRKKEAVHSQFKHTLLGIAAACGVALKLRAEKKPDFDREVALV